MTSWLSKQKKGDLIALADAAGYKEYAMRRPHSHPSLCLRIIANTLPL